MYRNEIKICSIFFITLILVAFCLLKNQELGDLVEKERTIFEQKNKIIAIAENFSRQLFHMTKPREKLFAKIENLKNLIKEISQKIPIKNVLLKKSSKEEKKITVETVEIKFSAKSERHIYEFINSFQEKSYGSVVFDLVKIFRKDSKTFLAKIICKIFILNDHDFQKLTQGNSCRNMILPSSIHIFPLDEEEKEYTLHCVIDKFKAYINDAWVNPGDEMDNFKVKNINQNSIDIQRDSGILNFKIGSSWR